MQASALLSVAALVVAANALNVTETTTTQYSTTEVTITSCSDNLCATLTSSALITTVTSTVDDVETVYTTYCPLTATEKEVSAAAVASSSSNEYVDVTVTPTVVTSVPVVATETVGTTFTSYFNGTTAVPSVAEFANNGNNLKVAAAVGIAPLVAALLL